MGARRMTETFRVLVVCVGNVCRSPLAERVLRMRFSELLPDDQSAFEVESAGVAAMVGSSMNESAAVELRRLGGDPDGFVSRDLDGRIVAGADLVLTATRQLRSRVLEEAPRALRRTFTLTEFAALVAPEAGVGGAPPDPASLIKHAASLRGAIEVEDYDVGDPMGRSQDVHRVVAELIERSCTVTAQALAGTVSTGAR